MALLYIASDAVELKPFAERLTGLRKLNWPIDYAYEGVWEDRRVILAANGAGPRLALRAVEVATRALMAAELSASKLEAIISTGFCGGLDPALKEEQIVIGTKVLNLDTGETFDCAPLSLPEGVASGLIITQDRIANDAQQKKALAGNGAIAVEMEAGAVAARARQANLPFYCIKVVSDRADESFAFNVNDMRDTNGRISRGKIVAYAFTHPTIIPAVFRLKSRGDAASKVLGDFLASCRIRTDSEIATTE